MGSQSHGEDFVFLVHSKGFGFLKLLGGLRVPGVNGRNPVSRSTP